MGIKCFVVAVFLCVLVVNIQGGPQQDALATTTEETTWDKIKKGVEHGWQVVHDESHCALHKVKGLVKPHDHDEGSDPCVDKPYQKTTSTTQRSIDLVAEEVAPLTSTPKPF